MNKFLVLFFTIFLSACSISIDLNSSDTDEESEYGEDVSFEIDQVYIIDSEFSDNAIALKFNLFLSRDDVGLKQPKNMALSHTIDLPIELYPNIMTIEEGGSSCFIPVYPHACETTITADELKKGSKEYEIYMEFEDGYIAKEKIEIPFPEMIEDTEIMFPVTAPIQGSAYKVKFKDVGADGYNVLVDLCHEYLNNGINPCLDGEEYHVSRNDGKLEFDFAEDFYMPTLEVKNDIIEVNTSMEVNYDESVQYTVSSNKSGEFENGIKYYVESLVSKVFYTKDEDAK